MPIFFYHIMFQMKNIRLFWKVFIVSYNSYYCILDIFKQNFLVFIIQQKHFCTHKLLFISEFVNQKQSSTTSYLTNFLAGTILCHIQFQMIQKKNPQIRFEVKRCHSFIDILDANMFFSTVALRYIYFDKYIRLN